LRPTDTADTYGEDFLFNGLVRIPAGECTDDRDWGCERQGNAENIINPIRSAKITTINSFYFKFGRLQIRAKLPAGDWIWPAIWLLPKWNVYGPWPNSGEIDLSEIRSNRALYNGAQHVGNQQNGHTMHFGPAWNVNGWQTAHYTVNRNPAWTEDFHVYEMLWDNTKVEFSIDGQVTGTVNADNGFWDRGGFAGSGMGNPWDGASLMAPFDQEFYLILNLAVGGTNFFPDGWTNNNGPKPWLNTSPTAMRDFWFGRGNWSPTWNRDASDDAHMQFDYVRIYAV